MKKLVLLIIACMCTMASQTCLAEVVTVLGNESLPWNGVKDGKNVGLMVDILTEASQYGAPEFNFQLGLPWERAQKQIQDSTDGSLVAIIPLTRTPAREAHYKWIAQLVANQMSLFTTGSALASLEEAKDKRIAVIQGFPQIPYMKEHGITKIDESPNGEINVKKLQRKRVDGIADSDFVAYYLWKGLGEDSKELLKGPAVSDALYIYIAANPSFPDAVAAKIKTAIDAMQADGKLEEIMNRWK